ncbi:MULTISPECIES: CopG family ribbon-helix-helix protein [Nostocales]|uniref:CopG family transcriptional regulator n=3 Tax=Nostocales TaxID=1161 RepID=A0A0C1R1C5_9CYAN|nr:CopG family transcriptional regulator [Tolypothrix bouteillei]KAF3887484.1 CopG family transcriptional regulator [Tolypothrix bouteillei VB521301]
MSKDNETFRFDSNERAKLDAAVAIERDRSDAIDKALNLSPKLLQWQLEEIHKGVAEADARDFASQEEVQAVFARLTDAS